MLSMSTNSKNFLDLYAKALNTFDPKIIASFCSLPTIIMHDNGRKIITSKDYLEQVTRRIFTTFNQAGIKKFVPQLQQTLRLSDTLWFSKMRWRFYNENEQLCFGCATSYTLQKMPDNQLKVIVMIIDDDEKKLAKIFNHAE